MLCKHWTHLSTAVRSLSLSRLCSVLLCYVLFCSVLFCYVLFCYIMFCFVLFCSALFCSVLFYSVLFCSVMFCYVLFCSRLYLPTAGSNPTPVLQLSLHFAILTILLPVVPLCHYHFNYSLCPIMCAICEQPGSEDGKNYLCHCPLPPPPAPLHSHPLHLTQFPSTFIIAHPYLPLCDCNSQSIVFHSIDVSSPCPFCIGCVLDYVCHPGDGATDSVFTLRFSIFPSMAHWLV